LKKERRKRCSNETANPPTLFFWHRPLTEGRRAFSLSVADAAQQKKKNRLTQQLNLDLLASNLLWFVSAPSLSLSPNLSDIDYSFNSLGRSLMFESINVTLHTLYSNCPIYLTYGTTGLQSNCKKNRNRPVIDSMIVICLLLSETSLFITCLPCCPPNNQSPWSSSPVSNPQTNLSIKTE
jgi:hypothetical protein